MRLLQLFNTMQLSKNTPPKRKSVVQDANGMVGVTGVEPVTSSLSGTRSNQLSYEPLSGADRLRSAAHHRSRPSIDR